MTADNQRIIGSRLLVRKVFQKALAVRAGQRSTADVIMFHGGKIRRRWLARPKEGKGVTAPDSENQFRVVVNDEEQYSIWPIDADLPLGWYDGGYQGGRAACLEHIDRVWTDMRPLSLRRQITGQAG